MRHFPFTVQKQSSQFPYSKKPWREQKNKGQPPRIYQERIKTILGRMELDKRLDAYAELIGRYARNSVSLEHTHMMNRGSADGYLEVAKYELQGRKISNRMAEILAAIMQDNAYREQAKYKTYPIPSINPINQLITSPGEADKITEAAQKEADNIMAIAFPSGAEPPLATTERAHSVPPTVPMATTVATVADPLVHGKQPRPVSPLFMMNAIPYNQPGTTANPLLIVNTGHDGNTNSFITPILATNCQNHQDNRSTVAFDTTPEADKQINTRLAEIANQGPLLDTMVISRPDHHIPDRQQFTNQGEHQYQSTYPNQNRFYSNNYNRTYNHTWESHTNKTCNNCGTKGHIAKHCTKTSFWCQWCHTGMHDTQACRSRPRSSTPIESPSAGSYHPTQSPNQHNTSSHQPVLVHTTQPSLAPSGSEEWAKLLVTHMEEKE